MRTFLVTVVSTLLLSGVAFAHPHDGGEGKEFDINRAKERLEQQKKKRAQVMEKVREVRDERIHEALKDGKRAKSVIKILNRFDDVRFEVQDARQLSMMQLRSQMQSEDPDDRTVESALDTLQEVDEKVHRARMEKLNELKKVLTPTERARFHIAERHFEREVRQEIKQHKRMRKMRRKRHKRDRMFDHREEGPGSDEDMLRDL